MMPSLSTLKLIGWGVIALSFIACLAALRMEQAQNGKLKAQLHESTTLRAADRAAYEHAQQEAAEKNKTQVAVVETEYQRNSDATKDAYARDHAELVRLRRERDSAAKGAAGPTGSPKDRAPTTAVDGDGVQVPPAADLQTSRDDAADIELRLMHLQNWVEKQLSIDPNTK